MFKWFTSFIDDARIAYAYIDYERECRKLWIADSERTHSTLHLEQDIQARMAEPMLRVRREYVDPCRDLGAKYENIQKVIVDAQEKLNILDRDYKSELDAAYELVNRTRAELDVCRGKLAGAYDDLNSAKSNLNSWYSKAEGNWFGNGGKQLPNKAFFGQDLNDRDRYKSRRDSAANDVGRYKVNRASIENRLNVARAGIDRVKEARQAMFDLKDAGFDKRIVTSAIRNGGSDLQDIAYKIDKLSNAKEDFIQKAKASLGVYALEREILRVTQAGVAHLQSFDSDPISRERKSKHRAEWLTARQRQD